MAYTPFDTKLSQSTNRDSVELFSYITSTTLPPLGRAYSQEALFNALRNDPGIFVGILFNALLQAERRICRCTDERTYGIYQLEHTANDTTIGEYLPCGVERKSGNIHLPQGHDAVAIMSLVDFVLLIGNYALRKRGTSVLAMNEHTPTLAYIVGSDRSVYVVGARWRNHCKRWFLFAQPFDGIQHWPSPYHFIFPHNT